MNGSGKFSTDISLEDREALQATCRALATLLDQNEDLLDLDWLPNAMLIVGVSIFASLGVTTDTLLQLVESYGRRFEKEQRDDAVSDLASMAVVSQLKH